MKRNKILKRLAGKVLAGLVLVSLFAATAPIPLASAEQEKLVPEEMRDKVQLLSTMPMLIAAESLGITEIGGKDVSKSGSPPGNAKAKKLSDVGIGVNTTINENEPTVVANPKDKKMLVAGSHLYPAPGIQCVAYTSLDGGNTWSSPIAMPMLNLASQCSDPVLAYAPDGNRVYYAYMDIKPDALGGWDIVVSYSNDNGQNWVGPIIALDGIPPNVYDKPWIGTHIDESQSNWVYVTATNFTPGPALIAFTRSGNQGVAWAPPTILDSAVFPMVVQGSRPTGGVGGEVLVAWYNSGPDGWLNGSFKIRTARSGNNGAAFDPAVDAVVESFEAPFWLGPFAFYHRWWSTMFPDVEIDSGGKAHIAYTRDPVANPGGVSTTPEDGDIRYISSSGTPYNMWSLPVTVNDDGMQRAQGFAALETQHGGKSSSLHVIWEDHRLSPNLTISDPIDCFTFPLGPCNSPNLYFDIFYSRKVPGIGVGWFTNFRVSDASSINDFIFIGDYNDLTANNKVFGIWTDRRHQTSIFADEDNVFGSEIIAGGGTP